MTTANVTLYDSQTTTITATLNGNTGTSTSFTVSPGGAVDVTASGYPSPTTAGVAHNVTVTALDAYDNVAPGYTGTVHFTSSDGQAVLPANYTFVAGDAGVHAFPVTLKTSGAQSITATDTVTGTISGTQSGISVLSGPATTLTVSGYPSPTTAGAAHNVTVTAKDAYGNAATGYTGTVHLTSSDARAVLPANYTFVAGDNGTHNLSVTLKTSGTQTITATDTVTGTITGTQSAITVNVGPATTFTVSGFTSPTTAGAAHNVTVTAYDAGGNLATGYTGTVHLTSSDAQAVLPANYTFTGGDAGTHAFSVTLKTSGTQSITATDTVTGTITGTQSGIMVNAAGPNKLGFVQQPTTTTAGTAISPALTVQVLDQYGNAVADSGATVAMTVSTGPGPFTGGSTTSAVTNASGLATFNNLVLNTSGNTYSLQAASSLLFGTSNTFTVNPASATTLSVSGFTTPTTAGVSHNVTVTAKDAFGNVATGYTGTVALHQQRRQGGPAGQLHLRRWRHGVHTFSVTLKTAGTQSITATDTVTGTITGTQGGITVNVGPTTTFVVSGFTTPTTAGAAHNVTVTAKDAFGNVATGYTGTVHFTSSDAQAVLPANYTFVAGDNGTHNLSVTLKTAGTQSITATDTVTGTITGTQSGISVNPAAATTLSVSGFTTPTTAGVSHNVTVTAKDAFGNMATGYTGTVALHQQRRPGGPAGQLHLRRWRQRDPQPLGDAQDGGHPDHHRHRHGDGDDHGHQGAITVNPAGAATFSVSGFTTPTTAGATHTSRSPPRTPSATWPPATRARSHFTSSDARAVLPANYTFVAGDNGVHTFSVTLKTAGTQSITATDTVTGTITGTQGGITVNVGADHHLRRLGLHQPDHGRGGPQRHGHGRRRRTATWPPATPARSTSPAATPRRSCRPTTPSSLATTGPTTFSVTLKTAGTQSITATDTVTGTITGTQSGITVNPAAATTLSVSGFTDPDHGRGGPQRHGHRQGRLRQRGHGLHRHGRTSPAATARRSCRPTTPSSLATTGSTTSR